MWWGSGLNREAWHRHLMKVGQVLEGSMRDDNGEPQGTVLIRVKEAIHYDAKGHFFTAEHLTASDKHYRWWISEGPGKGLRKLAHYHSCEGNANECMFKKPKTMVIHLELIRVIGEAEWAAGIPDWCFKSPCHANAKSEPKGAITLPWAEPGGSGDEDEESSSSVQDEGTVERIAKLKEELKRLEEKPKKKRTKKQVDDKKTRPSKSPERKKKH